MVYIITSVFFLWRLKDHYSLSKYLFTLLLLSSISAFFVGRQHFFNIDDLLYVFYIDALLCVLFCGYHNYSSLNTFDFSQINPNSLRKAERVISFIGYVLAIVDIFILVRIFSMLSSDFFTVQEFKNEGGAEDVFSSLVPSYLMTFGRLFSPLGYLFVALHFYYLVQENAHRSIKYLLLSLVWVLNGLITLSRSATVEYVLVYVGFFYFISPVLSSKVRKNLLKYVSIFGLIIVSLLLIISSSRFSDFYTKKSKNVAILDEMDNPLLFSSLDYFALWQEQSIDYMKQRTSDQIYYGMYNTLGLIEMIQKQIYGNKAINEKKEKQIFDKLGDLSHSFHGPIARLVYEFGYLGTILFIFLYYFILYRFSPQKGILDLKVLLAVPVLLPMGVLFFVGIGIGGLYIQIAIIYNILFYKFVKKHNQIRDEEVVTDKCDS